MTKKQLENISKILPDFLKNAVGYIKDNFDETGQTLLENSSGTAGLIIKFFAQPAIDKYFINRVKNRLQDFGYRLYLKAAFEQANSSLELIQDNLDNELSPKIVFEVLEESILNDIKLLNSEELILLFQPLYHPAIVNLRNSYERILNELKTKPEFIRNFIKDFNENIEKTIIKEFGEDYEKHLNDVSSYLLKESETKLLYDTIKNGKIGFKENENLKYEETFAEWVNVSGLRENDSQNFRHDDEYENRESALKPIQKLIEDFFNKSNQNHLYKILFIVADFGKGKSVFMKHYAAKLAKEYLEKSEGYFPIYFNLRNYSKYNSETKLGIISDFLETEYSIKIEDEYFQNKKYFFLIDSLDESGDLNKRSVDKVIQSIKNIQNINKVKYKINKIIVTSRPFDEGFQHHLSEHNPYTIKNKEDREVAYFINIYGFTKQQFNDWLYFTLKSFGGVNKLKGNGFAKEILDSIINNERIDIYTNLLKNGTLSRSELRRPIFAYMIYQLIINNVDFISVGKLGVYLSFLNLLTKDAKHIHDSDYKVNLIEELEFRTVLHSISSLWMHQRQSGKQGVLKKSDICRVLEGKIISTIDSEVLDKFKGQGFTEIQFLSHSYFGENDNILHFQHQSFAEILLAEYYLKVFIKYALDEDSDIEEARAKLIIGEPTEQTILFFKEMLTLLKDTIVGEDFSILIEKRKLLFPLMASLAIKKHNRLFCNEIFYSWFNTVTIKENEVEYPKELLENWCIDKIKLDKIIDLASKILNSKTFFLPIQANAKTALFDNEVLEVIGYSKNNLIVGIDKWLALIIGNQLHNDFTNIENPILFNWDYKINYYHLFDLITSWNYTYVESCPNWGRDLFQGIDMRENSTQLNLSHADFDGINFSYSCFNHVKCWSTNWSRGILNYCSFESVDFITSLFLETEIKKIKYLKHFQMMNCQATTSGFVLLDGLQTVDFNKATFRVAKDNFRRQPYIENFDIEQGAVFNTCSGFIVYGLQNSFFTIAALKKWFRFESVETKKAFFLQLDSLKEFEIKKPSRKKTL